VSLGLHILSTLVLRGEESLLIHSVTLCSEQNLSYPVNRKVSLDMRTKRKILACAHTKKTIYPAVNPSHCWLNYTDS